jgi:hypothetical protein
MICSLKSSGSSVIYHEEKKTKKGIKGQRKRGRERSIEI